MKLPIGNLLSRARAGEGGAPVRQNSISDGAGPATLVASARQVAGRVWDDNGARVFGAVYMAVNLSLFLAVLISRRGWLPGTTAVAQGAAGGVWIDMARALGMLCNLNCSFVLVAPRPAPGHPRAVRQSHCSVGLRGASAAERRVAERARARWAQVPMMRSLMTCLQETWLNHWIPFEKARPPPTRPVRSRARASPGLARAGWRLRRFSSLFVGGVAAEAVVVFVMVKLVGTGGG